MKRITTSLFCGILLTGSLFSNSNFLISRYNDRAITVNQGGRCSFDAGWGNHGKWYKYWLDIDSLWYLSEGMTDPIYYGQPSESFQNIQFDMIAADDNRLRLN